MATAATPPINTHKCEQIAGVICKLLLGGLLTDKKLPFDVRWIAEHNGVNVHVPNRDPMHIALNVDATRAEQMEVMRLLVPRMRQQGYQRFASDLEFKSSEWDDVMSKLGPQDGDTTEESADLLAMTHLVRSLMGHNGPEALAIALREMNATDQKAAETAAATHARTPEELLARAENMIKSAQKK